MHSFLSFVRNLSLCLEAQPQFFFLELQKSTPPEQGSGNTVAGSLDWGSDVLLRALKSLKYGQANCLRLLVLTLWQLLGICICKSQESIRILWSLLIYDSTFESSNPFSIWKHCEYHARSSNSTGVNDWMAFTFWEPRVVSFYGSCEGLLI